MKKEIKFPTILGLILLLAGLAVGVFLVSKKTIFKSKASGDCNPDNVQITNITDKSANISFITTSPCLATIEVNNQNIQDLKASLTGSTDLTTKIHYFEVKHLSPKTAYDFSVLSGGANYTNDSYSFQTGSTPSKSTPNSNLAWGKVLDTDGKTPASAIVFMNIPGSQPLSSLVTTNGNWSVSLATSFNESKTDWFTTPASAVTEDIIVIAADGSITQLTNTSARNNPVPNIILGKDSLEVSENDPEVETGQIQEATPIPVSKNVDIHNPKNGETLFTDKPQFFGSAPQDSTVIIEVHSPEAISGEVTTDSKGEWQWSPPKNLTPGEHTITVKVQNKASGLWETVTRNFTVLAAENNTGPQYEASGSATTPTPTLEPTSTPEPTEIPTSVPTVRVARPSTSVTPPVSGVLAPTILVLFISSIFVMLSIRMI